MMWELLGWLVAGCLALIVVALTIGIVVAIVKAIFAPTKPRTSKTVRVFKGGES